jgi:hypothetical protein
VRNECDHDDDAISATRQNTDWRKKARQLMPPVLAGARVG